MSYKSTPMCDINIRIGYTNDPGYINIPREFNTTSYDRDIDFKEFGFAVESVLLALKFVFHSMNISNACFQFKHYASYGLKPSNNSSLITNMLSAIYYGQVDITVPVFARNIERSHYATFTNPIISAMKLFAINLKPEDEFLMVHLLKPFQTEVWTVWIITLMLIAFILSLHQQNTRIQNVLSKLEMFTFSMLFEKRSKHRFRTSFERCMLFIWSVTSLISLLIYKGCFYQNHAPNHLHWKPKGTDDVCNLIRNRGYKLLLNPTSLTSNSVKSMPKMRKILNDHPAIEIEHTKQRERQLIQVPAEGIVRAEAAVDFMFIIDGSNAIGEDNFNHVRSLMARVAGNLPKGSRLSTIQFSQTPRTEFSFNAFPAIAKIINPLPELPQSPRAVAQLAVDDLPKTASVDQITAFIVQTEGQANVTANVRGPKEQRVPTKILDTGNNQYRVEFVPTAVGDHEVSVRFADVEVQGSPFMCRVYDARRIMVGNIPTEAIGTPVHFVIDASEAGVGNLEVAVNEGRVPTMAHLLGNHRYDISFVPRERTDHTVSIKFNNEAVPGSPFVCKILSVSAVSVSGTGLERVPVKRAASFNVEVQGASNNDKPVITVKDSTGQELPVAISAGGQQGTFRAEYTPQIVGNHIVNVSYAGGAVTGSPFTAKAFDASRVKLHPVEGNMVGKPNSFYIDAAKAGAGNMEIIVSVGNRNVPNFVQAEGNAKFKVSFTPLKAKQHTISVKFNGDPVPGSPMKTLVLDGSDT